MSDDQKAGISIDELLKQATDKTNGEITYANTVGVVIGENEIVIEFYFMMPIIPGKTTIPTLLQRMVLPLKLGAQIAEMLANGITQIEQQSHSLSNSNDLNK